MTSLDHRGRPIDFGKTADDYDRYRPGFPDSLFDRLTSLGWAGAGMRLLDVGTGTGSMALGLAARGLRPTGIDPATTLLEVARRRARERGLDASFLEAVAEHTTLPSASFELVTAGQCWWWLDARATIAECKRVLVPGGRIVIASFSYLALAGSLAQQTEQIVLNHNPGWPKAGDNGIYPEQVDDLEAAQLCNVESFSYVEPVRFTHEAWRGRMRACNGVAAALSPQAVAAFDRDLAALLSTYPSELVIPHRVHVVTSTV